MAAGDVSVSVTNPKAKACNVFDGVDDYIEIPHNEAQLGANLSNGFTISAWINPRSGGEDSRGRVFDKSNGNTAGAGFWFAVNNNSGVLQITSRINSGTIGVSANLAISLGNWQHILVTISSAQLANHYVNGVLSGTANQNLAQTISTITTTNAMRIGNRSAATDRTFDGSIRDVKMWNKVLTSAEITLDYAGGNPATDNLIHHFKLGGDYTDYGSVGVAATNSGSLATAVDSDLAAVIKAARVQPADKYFTEEINGKIMLAHIEELPPD